MAATKDFVIEQGKTFQHVLRWEAPPYIYKPITGITQTLPCRVTAVGHGLKDGWRTAVVSVKGMVQINAQNSPPKQTEFMRATYIDVDTIELNDVNSADYKAYTSGGYLQYLTPVDMAGYTARMKIKDRVGGTVLASTEAGDSPLNIISVTIDNTAKTITVLISATATAALTWARGVYELEMVSGSGVVTALLVGKISVTKEVTT